MLYTPKTNIATTITLANIFDTVRIFYIEHLFEEVSYKVPVKSNMKTYKCY